MSIARNLLSEGQPEVALDRALKAVEFNEDNPKALFLTSAIYAAFCNWDVGLALRRLQGPEGRELRAARP